MLILRSQRESKDASLRWPAALGSNGGCGKFQEANPRFFPTWAQCFVIFMAVLIGAHNPTLIPDLMTYLTDTATHVQVA